MMNYKEAMDYIDNTAKFGMNFGLSRTEKLLEFLGNPHKELKCIHLAGTNGKGSTSAMISTILKESGYKVGLFSSPYIEEFEERMQINGVNIPKEKLCALIEKVKVSIDKTLECGLGSPTQFEIITAIMFLYFKEENVDLAVIEVGLGGSLDCTNVINPIISAILSISLDHVNILGNTIREIAGEKAGIIKEDTPVVLYPVVDEAMEVFQSVAKEKNSKVISVREEECIFEGVEEAMQNICFKGRRYSLALLGDHQVKNASVALALIDELREMNYKIKDQAIEDGLKNVKWMGRLEVMSRKPLVVIDGAHNIGGIESICESLNKYFKYKNLRLVLGILGDKEVSMMVDKLAPMAKEIYTVTPHSERAMNAVDLEKLINGKFDVKTKDFEEYEDAYKEALENSDADDMVLVCGSLYMIGDMRKVIKNTK